MTKGREQCSSIEESLGVNCSPFLLGAVIDHHLKPCKEPLQSVAERLRTSFCMDTCVTFVGSDEDLRAL
jgi:hypothetical protein